jgi:hypothetical protein
MRRKLHVLESIVKVDDAAHAYLQAPAEEPILIVHGTLLETVPQEEAASIPDERTKSRGQRRSEEIRGGQTRSDEIRGDQRRSEEIRGDREHTKSRGHRCIA